MKLKSGDKTIFEDMGQSQHHYPEMVGFTIGVPQRQKRMCRFM